MKFKIVDRDATNVRADYEIRFIINDDLTNCTDRELLKFSGFEKGSVCNLASARRIYVSIKDTSPETLRIAISKALKVLSGYRIKSVKMPHISSPAVSVGGTEAAMEEIEAEFAGKGYGDFKAAVGQSVADELRPIRENFAR